MLRNLLATTGKGKSAQKGHYSKDCHRLKFPRQGVLDVFLSHALRSDKAACPRRSLAH